MSFENPGAQQEKLGEIGQLAAIISHETGLNEKGLSWLLRDIKYGDIAEMDDTIGTYKLEPVLNRPDIKALAQQGIENAIKENRQDAAEYLKNRFGL